jgi:hypothetical protein
VGNEATAATDPSGLAELTDDQKDALRLAPPSDRAALLELLRLAYHHDPGIRWFGNNCHHWAGTLHSKILNERSEGRATAGRITHWIPKYLGWFPLWWDHSVLVVELSNGKYFFIDNGSVGGRDRIFFDVPDILADEDSAYYKGWIRRNHNTLVSEFFGPCDDYYNYHYGEEVDRLPPYLLPNDYRTPAVRLLLDIDVD